MVRYLCANTHPDHDTICKFRRENFALVAECFVKVLELARELKLLKVGTISVDGTKVRANASKHRNVTYGRAGELVELLKADVETLMMKAEEADRNGEADAGKLPEQIGRRQRLAEQLQEARQRLEERARQQAEAGRGRVRAQGGRARAACEVQGAKAQAPWRSARKGRPNQPERS